MSDEERGPLIILAEERPIYVFCEVGDVTCPGEKCPIKKAFVPFGRGIVRVIDGGEATDDASGLISTYVQKEEFVVRSCEECRYNPVARAVIEELVNPRPREEITHDLAFKMPKMHAKIQGLAGGFSGPRHLGGLGDFFKDYSPALARATAQGIFKLEDENHQAHVNAHVKSIQRQYNEDVSKMISQMERASAAGLPIPPGPGQAFDEAIVKKALDGVMSENNMYVGPLESQDKEDDDDY